MGARPLPAGSGVKAEAAICKGFAGLSAIVGSLSWWSSPLKDLGIMLTTSTPDTAFTAPPLLDPFLAAAFFAAEPLPDDFPPLFLVVMVASKVSSAKDFLRPRR